MSPARVSLFRVLSEWRDWQLCQSAPKLTDCAVLPGGLTNQSWLLKLPEGRFVLRLNAANGGQLDINRQAEYQARTLAAAQQLAPAVRYRCPQERYWISDYLVGEPLSQQLLAGSPTDQTLQQLAGQLGCLHGLPLDDLDNMPRLQVAPKAAVYWQLIHQHYASTYPQFDWLALEQQLQRQLAAAPSERLSLCHMDANPDNWIHTTNGWQLLDWEYAALGHPYWDLAGLVVAAGWRGEVLQRWLAANQLVADDPVWQRALAQQQYFSVLWYGAQQLLPAERLWQQLQQLRINTED
ncbi:phosphotransferase [Oceanobacter mangrovi]|uniref:phosphotransferase n=1 Tax=Oceanobacter mangrovi TaxID=2862510 RepID=UPI001C8E1536|nr:phosphotransferase [Oceanobacter mangrovi]